MVTRSILDGVAERIGAEESCKLSWRRPTPIRLVISRVKYRVVEDGSSTVATAPVPPELLPRCLAAPALLAHIAVDKLCDGLPLHRRPYVDDFLTWSRIEYKAVKDRRGPLRSAFGYVVRQEDALRRFLEDGRLPLTNNQSERELPYPPTRRVTRGSA